MSFILWQIGQNNEPHEERVELIIVSFSEVLKEQRLDKGFFFFVGNDIFIVKSSEGLKKILWS